VRTPRGRDILAACGQLKSDSVKLRRSEALRREADAERPSTSLRSAQDEDVSLG
jgi:23S rRNA (adenine2503-C2)-methyltransferase